MEEAWLVLKHNERGWEQGQWALLRVGRAGAGSARSSHAPGEPQMGNLHNDRNRETPHRARCCLGETSPTRRWRCHEPGAGPAHGHLLPLVKGFLLSLDFLF